MKKKQVKYQIKEQQTNNLTQTLKLFFDNQYILKCILPQKLAFPPSITQKYDISYEPKYISFTIKNNKFYDKQDTQQISQYLKGLCVYHIRELQFSDKQEQVIEQIKWYKGNEVIGVKKFHIDQGRFQKGDYIMFSMKHVRNFINAIKSYIKNQSLLYELDTMMQQKGILTKYCETVTKIVVDTHKQELFKLGAQLQITISRIQDRYEQKLQRNRDIDSKPKCSINFVVSGNGLNIHDLYLKVEQIMNKVELTCVEIQEDSIPQSKGISDANNIFKQHGDKIFKISPFAILLLKSITDLSQLSQLKRKLKMKIWHIGHDDEFSVQQISILETEHKNKNLKHHMNLYKIFWQNIQFDISTIRLTCDRLTKNNFIAQCKLLLKSFIKVKNQCAHFDTKFYVEIFRKYYKIGIQKKYQHVSFQIGDSYIIRTNYNKYEEEIQEELKVVREKIKKKIIKFVSLKSIKSIEKMNANINPKFFPQKLNPLGYEHQQLGCSFYKMNNITIKLKKLQSLKHQQDCLIYLLDDRLQNCSTFYSIIQKNKLNLQSFLSDAHRAKKPQRLRQYITQQCQYAYRTILLHGGPQKVSNTLKKDIQILFGNLQSRICAVLLQHDGDFLWDVFMAVLRFLKGQAVNYYNNGGNSQSSNGSSNMKLSNLEIDFYYEGGVEHLGQIENVMKSQQLGIRRLSSFCLQEFDLEKIYALQYCSMRVLLQNEYVQVSPIIAQLTSHQLYRQSPPKKFTFSLHQQSTTQLVQYIINTRTQQYHKITHTQSSILQKQNKKFSIYPHIQKLQQLQSQLQQIVETIKKYFHLDYIVISGNSVSDGLHGRVVKYCKEIYMVKYEEDGRKVVPVTLVPEKREMYESLDREVSTYQLKVNRLREWYEITTYKDEFDQISHLISF